MRLCKRWKVADGETRAKLFGEGGIFVQETKTSEFSFEGVCSVGRDDAITL